MSEWVSDNIIKSVYVGAERKARPQLAESSVGGDEAKTPEVPEVLTGRTGHLYYQVTSTC